MLIQLYSVIHVFYNTNSAHALRLLGEIYLQISNSVSISFSLTDQSVGYSLSCSLELTINSIKQPDIPWFLLE